MCVFRSSSVEMEVVLAASSRGGCCCGHDVCFLFFSFFLALCRDAGAS